VVEEERMLVTGSQDDASWSEESQKRSAKVSKRGPGTEYLVLRTPTLSWDMGKSRNQHCNMTRVRIDHCRIEVEVERGSQSGSDGSNGAIIAQGGFQRPEGLVADLKAG